MSSRPLDPSLRPIHFVIDVAAAAQPGRLELWVGQDGAASDAVAQALALDAAMPLLGAVEAWLGAPIAHLRPAAPPLQWPSHDDALTLSLPDGSRLALPWAVLRPGHRFDAGGVAVTWPALACELQIEALASDRIDARALAPGAVLLLPASFAATAGLALPLRARAAHAWPTLCGLAWHPRRDWLRLTAPTLEDEAPSHQAGAASPSRTHGPSPGDGHAEPAWHIVAAEPLLLSAACWFGGGAERPLPPPRRATLRHGARALAHGALVPAGAGMGVLIEQCEPREQCEAAAA